MLERLVEYCRETRIDGVPLSKDPLVRQKLAQMAVELTVARLLNLRAAWMLNRGEQPDCESAVTKVFTSEALQRVLSEGLQILGLYSQLNSGSKWSQLKGELEQKYEFAILTLFGGGTNDILRNVIAQRGLGLPRG